MHISFTSIYFIQLFALFLQESFTPYQEQIPDTEEKIAMVPVMGGSFVMGAQDGEPGHTADETPRHDVVVDDFWIGQFEITWGQYEAFAFRNDGGERLANDELAIDGVSSATSPYVDMSNGMGKSGYPAIGMTHYAAVMYCKWLSAKTGHFYRLPTEAEWEYACKAGATTAFSYGDDPAKLDSYGVYAANSNYAYARIGSKEPNAHDIYDMSGNVSEWTMDQYSPDYYSQSEKDNPWNMPTKLYPRVVRGGNFKDEPEDCRCSARSFSKSSWKRLDPQIPKSRWWHTNAFFVGFRVVRPKINPSSEEIATYWLEPIEDYGK